MASKTKNSPVNKNPFNTILCIVLLIAAFALGYLVARVQILNTQETNNSADGAITTATIYQWAQDIGLNKEEFKKCFEAQNAPDIDTDFAAGNKASVSGTPTFFVNGIPLVGAQPFSSFKTVIDQELTKPDAKVKRFTVETGTQPPLGNPKAPVKIVEFSDFECPFCEQFFNDTYPQLKKEYIDTGKVVVYFRHYPLSFHHMARPLAVASECAEEQGKFWQLHDRIFER